MRTTLKNVVALGLAGFIGFTGQAFADSEFTVSDYVVIKDNNSEDSFNSEESINMGEWDGHRAWKAIYFELPENYDHNYYAVLQLNVNSTNKSKYNAIYLNPPSFDPGFFGGCDDIHNDQYEDYRVDYLPYADHDYWRFYHKTFPGSELNSGWNTLLICARNHQGEVWGDLDNFYLKDIVLHYRKHITRPVPQE
ncbi:MAG: hypothetical protein HC808_08585 [Candidatus Competibacteraceae bacterium]|nr:hypothetical protein [Candidatus Competibacteraceae bacterium]